MPSSTQFIAVPDSELTHVAGARLAGQVNPNEVAEVTLFVRAAQSSHDIEGGAQNLGGLRVRDRQYLTRENLTEAYGADPSDLATIESFANDSGLTVQAASTSQRTIRIAGTLASLAKTFKIQFAMFQSSQGPYRGYIGQVQVPAPLAEIVKSVIGLDNKPQLRYQVKKPQPRNFQQRQAAASASANQSYTPNEVASLYNFPSSFDGTGQCVGILEFGGGYTTTDLNTYFQSLGIATPNIVPVSVGGALNLPRPGPNSPDDEVMLDIEVVGAIASGAQIVVYFAPNTSLGFLRAINTAISDTFHNPKVISISWGGAEDTWNRSIMEAMNHAFKVAGLLGITICTAAGDNGYTDGISGTKANVDFPSSSPYVLSCGGTRLDSSGGKIVTERVWNDASGATGGGVSAIFAPPSYQSDASVPVSVNPPHRPGRGVPDVAGDADPNTGYRIRVDGQDAIIGGTSAVAPLWAALITLTAQKLAAPLGFVNPLLYSQGVEGGGFNDIVIGNNGTGANSGYAAGPGWDACSGLGTPNGTTLSDLL